MKKENYKIISGTKLIGTGPEFNLLHQLFVVHAKQTELHQEQAELLNKLIDVLAEQQGAHKHIQLCQNRVCADTLVQGEHEQKELSPHRS